MPVERWSDQISVVHLADDPQFSDDLQSIQPMLDGSGQHVAGSNFPAARQMNTSSITSSSRVAPSFVLDFGGVRFVNSSNLARLLMLRRHAVEGNAKLMLCNVNTQVWGTFLVTGLDKVFDFSDNVTTALATLQMNQK